MGGVRVTFSIGLAAAELWAFGEDDLARAVLDFSDADLLAAWRLAAVYKEKDYPLPVYGRLVSNGHVVCFACMKQVEDELRPLARQRRRPAKGMPVHLQETLALPAPDVHRIFGDH